MRFFVLGAVFVSICFAQQRHLMLVASKGMPGVTLYNADNEEVVCKAKLELAPHEVAFSPNGRTAYVPIYGNTVLGTPGSNEHAVFFLNSRDCRVLARVDTDINTRPHGIVAGKSGKLYVTTETARTVTLLDAENHSLLG